MTEHAARNREEADRTSGSWLTDGTEGRFDRRTRLAVAGVLGLATAGAALNLAAVGIPYLAPMFVFVFVAGIFGGPLVGAVTGALSMAVLQLMFGGVGVYSVAPVLGMAEAGGLAGFLARLRFRSRLSEDPLTGLAAVAVAGVALTLVFSIVADVTEWFLVLGGLVPAAHTPYVGAMVAAGLTFNLGTALVNGPLLAAAAYAAVALMERGLARETPAPWTRRLVTWIDDLAWDRRSGAAA